MSTDNKKNPSLTRRSMLMKLGLGATVAYMAPVMLKLGEAHASGGSRGSASRGSFSDDRRRGRVRRPDRPAGRHRSFSRRSFSRRSFS